MSRVAITLNEFPFLIYLYIYIYIYIYIYVSHNSQVFYVNNLIIITSFEAFNILQCVQTCYICYFRVILQEFDFQLFSFTCMKTLVCFFCSKEVQTFGAFQVREKIAYHKDGQ